MKRLLYTFMCLMLVLSACNKEEKEINDTIPEGKEMPRFHGVKYPVQNDSSISEKGVAQYGKLWHPNTTIKVKFLDGSAAYQNIVKEAIAEWEQHIGLKFEYPESGKADVRITFDSDSKFITWSYTGTDCKYVRNQNEPTANFAEWRFLSEGERNAEALRVIGMVLGLEMEHRHLNVSELWEWNKNIQAYWSDIEDIDWDELKEYVIDPLQRGDIVQTAEFDPNSIMVWPFPARYRPLATAASVAFIEYIANDHLSANDISFIKQLYPKEQVEEEAIVVMKVDPNYDLHLSFISSERVIVDWGDGNRDNMSAGYTHRLSHEYAIFNEERTIKIHGSNSAIKTLEIIGLTYLDVSKSTELCELSCSYGKLISLDVSKNTKLQKLSCAGHASISSEGKNKLSALDVSKNTKLTELDCSNNRLTSLDVSKNIELMQLYCNDNQLTTLDVSKNTELVELNCRLNRISSLDMSKNTELAELYCGMNLITSLDVSKNTKLQMLSCYHNPFITDQSASASFVQFITTLPNVTNGTISLFTKLSPELEAICNSKNWTVKNIYN